MDRVCSKMSVAWGVSPVGNDSAAPLPRVASSALSRIVIAVDGPSGSGKSSTSRGVAQQLGLRYLDTGAMYRAMTRWMLIHGIDVSDAETVAAHVETPQLDVGTDPSAPVIVLDGEDVSAAVRGRAVTEAVSAVSAVPAVRARMVALQRAIIGTGGVVVEGRDIGTTVAPDAAVKVYLVASADARAVRRHAELEAPAERPRGAGESATRRHHGAGSGAQVERGEGAAATHIETGGELAAASVEETRAALRRRDSLDSTRAASPLACADDAVVLDSTDHSLEEVIDLILELVATAVR